MGVSKRTRKFGATKRVIGQRDARLARKGNPDVDEKKEAATAIVRVVPQVSSSLFFQYNTALVPPYSVLVDTNFLSHTVQRKLPLLETMMDTLFTHCILVITSCGQYSPLHSPPDPSSFILVLTLGLLVMAELEKLGPKYRIALRIARDERWERLACTHRGTYADDCLVDRVMHHRIYIVGTNDRELKRRLRKVPGVPILSVARQGYIVERLPDAPEK